jgi:hypothetical protein
MDPELVFPVIFAAALLLVVVVGILILGRRRPTTPDTSSTPEPWSPQRAKKVEEMLTMILQRLPDAIDIQGVSKERGGHTIKFIWKGEADYSLNFCYLSYSPSDRILNAWTDGFRTHFFCDVFIFFETLFSDAKYEPGFKFQAAVSGFHYLNGITEDQLRAVAKASTRSSATTSAA